MATAALISHQSTGRSAGAGPEASSRSTAALLEVVLGGPGAAWDRIILFEWSGASQSSAAHWMAVLLADLEPSATTLDSDAALRRLLSDVWEASRARGAHRVDIRVDGGTPLLRQVQACAVEVARELREPGEPDCLRVVEPHPARVLP